MKYKRPDIFLNNFVPVRLFFSIILFKHPYTTLTLNSDEFSSASSLNTHTRIKKEEVEDHTDLQMSLSVNFVMTVHLFVPVREMGDTRDEAKVLF